MNNKIKIKLGQIEFEAEGDSELIEREREQFFKLLPHAVSAITPVIIEKPESKDILIPAQLDEELNINDIVIESDQIFETLPALFKAKNFSNDTDKVLGVAYFLDHIKGKKPFNVKDIEEALSEARQPKSTNTNSLVNRNIKKSYLIAQKEKKDSLNAYLISSDGIDYIENYIPSKKKNSSKTKVVKKSQTQSNYNSITREELNIEKYPIIKKLPNFKSKMLVAMYIFNEEKKGEYFTVHDIMYIMTNIFGEKASKDQVSGVFKREIDWFNKVPDEKNKKAVKYKMLNNAFDFVNAILTKEKTK